MSDTTPQEGETITVTVTRDGAAAPSQVRVRTNSVGRPAEPGVDYSPLNALVEFSGSTVEETHVIEVFEDRLFLEGTEDFEVLLDIPDGCDGPPHPGLELHGSPVQVFIQNVRPQPTEEPSDPDPDPTDPGPRPTQPGPDPTEPDPDPNPVPNPTSTPDPAATATGEPTTAPTEVRSGPTNPTIVPTTSPTVAAPATPSDGPFGVSRFVAWLVVALLLGVPGLVFVAWRYRSLE